jgi:hypothetical protein
MITRSDEGGGRRDDCIRYNTEDGRWRNMFRFQEITTENQDNHRKPMNQNVLPLIPTAACTIMEDFR